MAFKIVILLILLSVALVVFIHKFPIKSLIQQPELKQEILQPALIPPSPLAYPNLRWDHMPLSVFIDSRTPVNPSYVTDFRLALDTWKEATNNLISFQLANGKDTADVTVTWADKLRERSLDAAGDTNIQFYNRTNFKILTKADIELLNKIESKTPTDFDMINLAAHEVGHALGLDHNNVEGSVMSPVLKIPSKEIKNITKPEIQLLLDTYSLLPKPDLYISNATAAKVIDNRVFRKDYYINAVIYIENIGLVNSTNVTLQIKADGKVVRQDTIPEMPIGSILTRTYTNLAANSDFNAIEIIADPENTIDEINENNNIVVLKV